MLPLYQRELCLGCDSEEGDNEGRLFLVWPVIIQHCINESSPLWDVSADDLTSGHKHFEIIVILEGIVECTGMTTQVTTAVSRPIQRCGGVDKRGRLSPTFYASANKIIRPSVVLPFAVRPLTHFA